MIYGRMCSEREMEAAAKAAKAAALSSSAAAAARRNGPAITSSSAERDLGSIPARASDQVNK